MELNLTICYCWEALFTSQIIKIVYGCPNYLEAPWLSYQKSKDKKFSFTDVASFTIMKEFKIKKAFAFDRGFLQAGFELASEL